MGPTIRAMGLLVLCLTAGTLQAGDKTTDKPNAPPWKYGDKRNPHTLPKETSAEDVERVERTAAGLHSFRHAMDAIIEYFEYGHFIRLKLQNHEWKRSIDLSGYEKLLTNGLPLARSPAEVLLLLNNRPPLTGESQPFAVGSDQRGQFSRAVSAAIRANEGKLREDFANADDKTRRELAQWIIELGQYDRESGYPYAYQDLGYSFDPSLRAVHAEEATRRIKNPSLARMVFAFRRQACRLFARVF
jgi:hypothetical protein